MVAVTLAWALAPAPTPALVQALERWAGGNEGQLIGRQATRGKWWEAKC